MLHLEVQIRIGSTRSGTIDGHIDCLDLFVREGKIEGPRHLILILVIRQGCNGIRLGKTNQWNYLSIDQIVFGRCTQWG